jgi:hypothetical protein
MGYEHYEHKKKTHKKEEGSGHSKFTGSKSEFACRHCDAQLGKIMGFASYVAVCVQLYCRC